MPDIIIGSFNRLQSRYLNGGMLFSICTLVFIALISLYSFLLLVKTKFVVPGSFGGGIDILAKSVTQFKLISPQTLEELCTDRGYATPF